MLQSRLAYVSVRPMVCVVSMVSMVRVVTMVGVVSMVSMVSVASMVTAQAQLFRRQLDVDPWWISPRVPPCDPTQRL
jgi:hypothetical protein